jgi:hypothetical protein
MSNSMANRVGRSNSKPTKSVGQTANQQSPLVKQQTNKVRWSNSKPTQSVGQTANQPRWLVERRTGTPDPPKPAADTPGPRRLPDKLSCGACLFGPAPRVARPSDLIPVASAPNPFRPPRRVGRPGSTHPTKPGQQENRKKTISRRGAGEGFRNQTVTRPPPNTARPPGRPATGAGRRSAALNPTLPRPRPRRPAPGWHKILAQTGTI